MESLWSQSVVIPERNSLPGNGHIDVAVIGGGLCGILTAYLLKQQGMKTVVLEARRIGSGQTQNTTAKITCQHDLIYDRLLTKFGLEKAKQYADANQQAVSDYKDLIAQHMIDCEFEEKSAYLYTLKNPSALEKEAKAASVLRIPCKLIHQTELPFSVAAALAFEKQAQFHPLKFLKNIAQSLTVYENTTVYSIHKKSLFTDHGTLNADRVVFATHFPFINFPGHYFMKMHQERSYVLALQDAYIPDGMYLGIDPNGLSLRSSGDLLLLGGGGHRTGERSKKSGYSALQTAAASFFPNGKEVCRWSAQDCMPADHIPYIGPYSPSKPNWYVATGFGKWGMTSSMAAAQILSDELIGRKNPYREVFSPRRKSFLISLPAIVSDGWTSAKGLASTFLTIPAKTLAHVPKGHADIILYQGKKVGVYKNEKEEVFFVSVRCPHLGCQLNWNPDELSWDCPCHGSRFDYTGKLIDNPSQKGIQKDPKQ